MQVRRKLSRVIIALGVAAACAAAFDAAVALAGDQPAKGPTSRPTTAPAFVGGSISNEVTTPAPPAPRPPTIVATPNGGNSVTGEPADVVIGGGMNSGQSAPPPRPDTNSYHAPATTQPAAVKVIQK